MNNQNEDQQQQQMGFGLARYRSAPSSLFASLLGDDDVFGNDGDALDRLLINPRAVSPETQRIFSRFMNGPDNDDTIIRAEEEQPPSRSQFITQQFENRHGSSEHPSPAYSSQTTYHNHHHHGGRDSDAPASSFKSDHSANNSGLVRYNSSPAGFLATMNMENGAVRDMGRRSYGVGNTCSSVSSTRSRFRSPMYDKPSSSNMMAIDSIPGIEPNKAGVGIKYENSWDDSDEFLSDSFLDNAPDQDHHQNHRLVHHLSLPKTSSEIENMLQDSVPCKMRAKRGCATHPRSIAERVRRNKINERMRKLQELVPNMDKQTSTSDMLDLAVDYIKDLQRQVKALTDVKAKCKCRS